MRINHVIPPVKSSFLSMEKDLGIIIDKITSNPRLQKLVYYNTKDPLREDDLTEDQLQEMMEHSIKIVPYIDHSQNMYNYIIIDFDNFMPNETNPEFRDNMIYIDVLCHKSVWQMRDFQSRPYRIAAEIDAMLDKQRLTGIGKLEFLGTNQATIPNSDYGGVTLMYYAVHGEEDKQGDPNPFG